MQKHDLLQKERDKNRKLRDLPDRQRNEIVQLASVNEALRIEIALLNSICSGKSTKGVFGHKKGDNE